MQNSNLLFSVMHGEVNQSVMYRTFFYNQVGSKNRIDLSVNGEDISTIGIRKGFYKSWKHKNGRSVEKKPSWCNGK